MNVCFIDLLAQLEKHKNIKKVKISLISPVKLLKTNKFGETPDENICQEVRNIIIMSREKPLTSRPFKHCKLCKKQRKKSKAKSAIFFLLKSILLIRTLFIILQWQELTSSERKNLLLTLLEQEMFCYCKSSFWSQGNSFCDRKYHLRCHEASKNFTLNMAI